MARHPPDKHPRVNPPRRSLKPGYWSLVVTVLILALTLLPYMQRW